MKNGRELRSVTELFLPKRSQGKKLSIKVEKLHRFDSFDELYKSLPLLKCGYTEQTVTDAKPSDMEEYYSAEEQKKYGVVGIEVSRLNEDTDETVVVMARVNDSASR